ncbi:hypothetical protein Tco_0525151 [Tanacetum coccineum]
MGTQRSESPKVRMCIQGSFLNHTGRTYLLMKRERKAKLCANGGSKKSSQTFFHAWRLCQREFGQLSKTRIVVIANSKKYAKSCLNNMSDEDANQQVCLRSLPPAWDSLAMTMRTKKNIDTLSIDDLYNNLSVFEQDIQKTSSSSLASDNVAFLSQAKASSSKHKPSQSSGSYSSVYYHFLCQRQQSTAYSGHC